MTLHQRKSVHDRTYQGHIPEAATDDHEALRRILAAPLPELPDVGIASLANEVRAMETSLSKEIWRHPGWAPLVMWILQRVPDCDPTVAALQAIRHAAHPVNDDHLAELAALVVKVARRSPFERPSGRLGRLQADGVEEAPLLGIPTASLSVEAADLFAQAGIEVGPIVWRAISEGVDIAVDWWVDFATRSGLTGSLLVETARGDTSAVSSDCRLRSHFQGPVARPLVALLLGGDQWGRHARAGSGQEASLVLWALEVRRARLELRSDPVPADAIHSAWCATVAHIRTALTVDSGGSSSESNAAA